MTPKITWLTTIGLTSCALLAAVPLSQAASDLWKPEVAHAAKVTVRLVKSKSFNPIAFTRRSRIAPSSVKFMPEETEFFFQSLQTSPALTLEQPETQAPKHPMQLTLAEEPLRADFWETPFLED